MSDSEMMTKHRLDVRGLQSLFRKLVEAGLVARNELDRRMPGFMATAFVADDSRSRNSDEPWKLKIRKHSVTEGRPVKASEVLGDIRMGMDDHALMDKYRLSSRGMQDLMEKLILAGLLTQAEVDDRMPSYDSTVDLRGMIDDLRLGDPIGLPQSPDAVKRTCPVCGASHSEKMRKCPKCGFGLLLSSRGSGGFPKGCETFRESGRYLVCPVPVYEIGNPRIVGTITDITEKAVGVTGIPARLEETKTLVVAPEDSLRIASFRFHSTCRWTDRRKPDHFARFEITAIGDKDRKNLTDLIAVLTFGF